MLIPSVTLLMLSGSYTIKNLKMVLLSRQLLTYGKMTSLPLKPILFHPLEIEPFIACMKLQRPQQRIYLSLQNRPYQQS